MNSLGPVHPKAHKGGHSHSSVSRYLYLDDIALTTGERTFQRVVLKNSLVTLCFFDLLITLYV